MIKRMEGVSHVECDGINVEKRVKEAPSMAGELGRAGGDHV